MDRRIQARSSRLDANVLTGIPEVDREHEMLVARLGQLESVSAELRDEDVFTDLLSRLGRELAAHFESEEDAMRRCGLPEAMLREHVQAHDRILDQFARYNLDRMRGMSQQRAETLAMIRRWIKDHMDEYDVRLRDCAAQPVA